MQLEINARHFTLGDDQKELIEAAVEKRRVTLRELLGTFLAVAGVGVLTAI